LWNQLKLTIFQVRKWYHNIENESGRFRIFLFRFHPYPWVLASHVAQVFYMTDPQTNLPQKRRQSTWLSLENSTLSELMAWMMLMSTISTLKCSYSQTYLRRSVLCKRTYQRHCHENEKVSRGKLLRANCSTWSVCVSVYLYVCEITFMYVCETTFMYMCETT
jgi:hypothetical protein